MPFIVRCPHCRRFMLIEDESRGATGQCLLCKGALLFDASLSDHGSEHAAPGITAGGSTPGRAPSAAAPPKVPSADTEIRICPSCQAKMRLPIVARGKKVRCPKCQHEFR